MEALKAFFWQMMGKLPNPNPTWDKGVHQDDPDQDGHPFRKDSEETLDVTEDIEDA